MRKKKKHIRSLVLLVLALIAINWIGDSMYQRFDLTEDKRYSLSEAAVSTFGFAKSPILVEVLLEGSLPAEFRRLQGETRQILEEFASHNTGLKFTFIDPAEGEESPDEIQSKLMEMGITPAQVSVREGGKLTQEVVYPWAIVSYEGRAVKVPLLKNQLGATSEERITASIQNLEYAFADAFHKIILPKRRKVAVLRGNGQLEDKYIADFFRTLREYYYIAPFTLDSAAVAPVKTLQQLQEFDLIVSAKPTEQFTENEKYILDQFTMAGGKSLWLIDQVAVEMQDLFETGSSIALRRDLNLTDFFFRYGIRINPVLVNDMYSAPVVLASGTEAGSQYDQYPWFYFPLSSSTKEHPVVNNMEAVKFEFANAIEILESGVEKTVLLSSSPFTRLIGTPAEINLDEIEFNLNVINTGPEPQLFPAGEVPLAVLMEGTFTSVYKNRVKPFPYTADKSESMAEAKMIVISDGDVIKNQLQGNRPLELGFDRWTNTMYGNKDFLLNGVNYLLDDTGLINIRSKEISIAFLDTPRVLAEKSKWQMLNLLLPLAVLAIFGFVFHYLRKRKYT